MISGIILASGFSRRMGKEKLLLKVAGIPMLARVIHAAQGSMLDELILIYHSDEVKRIGEVRQVRTAYNPEPEKGQSAAVKRGVACAHPESSGFMFLVGDQPYLTSSTIDALITAFNKEKNRIVVPVYGAERGNPVIFPAVLKPELLSLEGDRGGRSVIDRMQHLVTQVAIALQFEATDIDTEEEYEKIRDRKG